MPNTVKKIIVCYWRGFELPYFVNEMERPMTFRWTDMSRLNNISSDVFLSLHGNYSELHGFFEGS